MDAATPSVGPHKMSKFAQIVRRGSGMVGHGKS